MRRFFPIYLTILSLGIISLFSCGNKIKYTVKYADRYEHRGGPYGLSAGIIIPEKMPKENLLKLGRRLRRRWSDILLMEVRIFVPSDYPDEPADGWWCTYHYERFGKKSEFDEYIQYMGPPTKEVEDSLKNIKPMEGKLLGKWFLKQSANEKSIFLIETDSVYYLEMHRYVDKDRGHVNTGEIITLEMMNADKTQFRNKENTQENYEIDKDGNLILVFSNRSIAQKY